MRFEQEKRNELNLHFRSFSPDANDKVLKGFKKILFLEQILGFLQPKWGKKMFLQKTGF